MMYKSPITKETEDIIQEIVLKEEECLMRSVHKVGFEIDKEELRKALQYDRDQYEKGFIDGELSAKPRKGRWVVKADGWNECPFCNSLYRLHHNFCPNCGADMRGEEDENKD